MYCMLYKQCLQPLKWRGVIDTTSCDQVCLWLATYLNLIICKLHSYMGQAKSKYNNKLINKHILYSCIYTNNTRNVLLIYESLRSRWCVVLSFCNSLIRTPILSNMKIFCEVNSFIWLNKIIFVSIVKMISSFSFLSSGYRRQWSRFCQLCSVYMFDRKNPTAHLHFYSV